MGRVRLITAVFLGAFGVALIAGGLWLLWPPLALIAFGSLLVAASLRMEVDR